MDAVGEIDGRGLDVVRLSKSLDKVGCIVMTVKLSRRLMKIAEKVPLGSRLADIGSDHALLPVYLVQQGKVQRAIAGELNEGPYESARQQVANAQAQSSIEVRRGDGLEVIFAGEADTITIAGMGGSLIVQILTSGQPKLQGVSRLVLQPNVGEETVRRWLDREGWRLSEEEIVSEDGRIYEILVAEPAAGNEPELYPSSVRLRCGLEVSRDLIFRFGPYFLNDSPAEWFAKWEQEREKLEAICRRMDRSNTDISQLKQTDLRRQIDEIKEVVTCLQQGIR